jgi:hypothetical protein
MVKQFAAGMWRETRMDMNEILIMSLVGLSFLVFSGYTISTLFYLFSDRPLIAERLRRYGFVRGE